MSRLPIEMLRKAPPIANALLDERPAIRVASAATRSVWRTCVWLCVPAFLLAVSSSGAAQAPEPRPVTLLREHKCYVCHANDDVLAGPAFADVAAHYRGNPNAIVIVMSLVRRGEHGGAPWHMPPHPEVSADDARAMAQYILSLDRRPPAGGMPPVDRNRTTPGVPPRS